MLCAMTLTNSTDTTTTTDPDRTARTTAALALVAGFALVVDTVTIAVINRSFDPLDSILFLTGFVGMLATCVALAVQHSAGQRGARRAAYGAAIFAVVAIGLGAISFVCDEFGRHAFAASNKGLHGEWSFFSIGISLLVVAALTERRRRRTAHGPLPSTCSAS